MNDLMSGFVPSGELAEMGKREKQRPIPTRPYEFENDFYPFDKAKAVLMFEEECRKLKDNFDGVKIATRKVCQHFTNGEGQRLINGRLALWIVEVKYNKHSPITIEYNIIKKNRKLAPMKGKKKRIKETGDLIDAGFYRMELPKKRASRHHEPPKPLGAITHKDKLKMIKIDLSKEFEEGVDKALGEMKKLVKEHQNG